MTIDVCYGRTVVPDVFAAKPEEQERNSNILGSMDPSKYWFQRYRKNRRIGL